MFGRRPSAALSLLVLCLLVTSTGRAAAAEPGELTAFEVANRQCIAGAIAPAPARGVLVRLCWQSAT